MPNNQIRGANPKANPQADSHGDPWGRGIRKFDSRVDVFSISQGALFTGSSVIQSSAHEGSPDTQSGAPKGSYIIERSRGQPRHAIGRSQGQLYHRALTRASPTRNRALPRAAMSSSAHEGIPDTQSGAPKGSYVIRLESVDSDTVGIQVAVGVCPGKVCSGVLGPSSPGFSPEVF